MFLARILRISDKPNDKWAHCAATEWLYCPRRAPVLRSLEPFTRFERQKPAIAYHSASDRRFGLLCPKRPSSDAWRRSGFAGQGAVDFGWWELCWCAYQLDYGQVSSINYPAPVYVHLCFVVNRAFSRLVMLLLQWLRLSRAFLISILF